MPSYFDIEKFNAGDEQEFSRFYTMRYKTILVYAKYKTHDERKAWMYANMAFQQLKRIKPKNFNSINHITEWLKQTIENIYLVYDSKKPD